MPKLGSISGTAFAACDADAEAAEEAATAEAQVSVGLAVFLAERREEMTRGYWSFALTTWETREEKSPAAEDGSERRKGKIKIG
jgi:hypothetical protein